MPINCIDIYGKIHRVERFKIIKRKSAYGIYIKNQKILLVQNIWTPKWELPGGGVNSPENNEKGLEREFFEETGLLITGKFEKIGEDKEYFYNSETEIWDNFKIFYLISNAKGELIQGNGDDIKAARYFTKIEFLKLYEENLLHNVNKNLLDKIIELM